jgi:RNA polymerase sigma-70 factor (ECF subfamily)
MDTERTLEIVTSAIAGDADAFERLYSICAQRILYHVRELIIDKENYEDVAQEVAIELFKGIGALKSPKAFQTWLYCIIRNTCIDHNRKFLNHPESKMVTNSNEVLGGIITEAYDENPEQMALSADESERLFALIEGLPPAYRESIVLRYYDGLSYMEIARTLGISISAVSTNLMKAKKRLKKNMIIYKRKSTLDIKKAMAVGVNGMIPVTVVNRFIETGSAQIAASGATKSTGAMVASVKSSAGPSTQIIAGVACALTVTALAGGFIIDKANENSVNVSEAMNAGAPPAVSDPGVIYSGDPHIIFENAKGKDSSVNPISIRIEDEKMVPDSVAYTVRSETGATVLTGNGKTLNVSSINELSEGTYKVRFMLTEKDNAVLYVSRSFYLSGNE